ncbi:MAG: hypothetical protein QOJ98_2335 [Acidobacteriota bacterium]|jgi:hypothetical protein|nr:hypothetical protein [Acidobacteriota bacterium]
MTRSIPITLPGGRWRNGALERDALLRPLRGEDELFLAEEAEGLTPARRTTLTLVRCLERLGDESPVSLESARTLTAGDREAILLHLRRATFGEKLTSVLRCPRGGCDERMDLELRVSDLLVAPPDDPAEVHSLMAEGEEIRFRLPNGADLEEAAELAQTDVDAAARLLLERCVLSSPVPDASALSARMAELDPQAELILELTCTKCERPFTALFDTASFLFGELAARRGSLYREVHQLALHYHWSESDILALTPTRRRRYLDLLAESLAPKGKR